MTTLFMLFCYALRTINAERLQNDNSPTSTPINENNNKMRELDCVKNLQNNNSPVLDKEDKALLAIIGISAIGVACLISIMAAEIKSAEIKSPVIKKNSDNDKVNLYKIMRYIIVSYMIYYIFW